MPLTSLARVARLWIRSGEYLGISPAARQHLANSRIEFLKALREMLDARIDHLSGQSQKGTKVAVE